MILRLTQILVFLLLGCIETHPMESNSQEKEYTEDAKLQKKLLSVLVEKNGRKRALMQEKIALQCYNDLKIDYSAYENLKELNKKKSRVACRNLIKILWLGIADSDSIFEFFNKYHLKYVRIIREMLFWTEVTDELLKRNYGHMETSDQASRKKRYFSFNVQGIKWMQRIIETSSIDNVGIGIKKKHTKKRSFDAILTEEKISSRKASQAKDQEVPSRKDKHRKKQDHLDEEIIHPKKNVVLI